MLLFQTDGFPRDGCVHERHEDGRVVHMDECWTPLEDDTNTTTGSDHAA